MKNNFRLKKHVALAIAMILVAGMAPLSLAAAMMATDNSVGIAAMEARNEPPYPDAPHYYDDMDKPADPDPPYNNDNMNEPEGPDSPYNNDYTNEPADPDAPDYYNYKEGPTGQDSPYYYDDKNEPEEPEYPEDPQYQDYQYEYSEQDYEFWCDEYCEGCEWCDELKELDMMAMFMQNGIQIYWDFVPFMPGGVSPIVPRGTMAAGHTFTVAIPAVNFNNILMSSPGSLFLEFALSGGAGLGFDGGGNFTVTETGLLTGPGEGGVHLRRVFTDTPGAMTNATTTRHTNSSATVSMFSLDALFYDTLGANRVGSGTPDRALSPVQDGAVAVSFDTVGGNNAAALAVTVMERLPGLAPRTVATILPSTPLVLPDEGDYTPTPCNYYDYRNTWQPPVSTPEPEPTHEPSSRPRLPYFHPPPDIIIHVLTYNEISVILLAVEEYGYAVINLLDTLASGVDIPGHLFDSLDDMNAGLVIMLPDGTLNLDAELVSYIAAQGANRVELILYHYEEEEIIEEVLEFLCHSDEVFNVQLLVDGEGVTYFPGRLSITVEHAESPTPGVWRIGYYGDVHPQESVFDAEAGLVTFFPDRLTNFIVGYSAYARIMAIFRADGNNATLYSRGRQTTNLRGGQRLSSGDRLTTGDASEIYVSMDNSSILKLGENSQAVINETGQNLEIQVLYGNALVRIDSQQSHHSTSVRAQNTTTGVRGTMFTVSVDADGSETIVMLSGYAEINGVPLMAGYMYVLAYGAAEEFAVTPITLDAIDDFTLAAIVGNFDYLEPLLGIDLTGVDIVAQPLPTLQEIMSLPLEDYALDEDFCDDDCEMQDEPHMLPGREQFDRRC